MQQLTAWTLSVLLVCYTVCMDKTDTDLLRDELARVVARLENAHATNASPDQVQAWKRRTRELRDWVLESENPTQGLRVGRRL